MANAAKRSQQYIKEVTSLGPYFKALGKLTFPFFRSDQRHYAWGYLIGWFVAMILTIGAVIALVQWSKEFFDLLEARDAAKFPALIVKLFVILAAVSLMSMFEVFFLQMFEFRWRMWLSLQFFDTYLDDQRFQTLELRDYGIDNPDQRIAVDIRDLAFNTISLGQGFVRNTLNGISFISVLWAASGTFQFAVGASTYAIPGYLVWVALVYIALVTWVGYRIGKPLIALQAERQRVEADLRFTLIGVREDAESIALIGSEGRELRRLQNLFGHIRRNWYQIVRVQAGFVGFQQLSGQVGGIVTHIANAPRYLLGQVTLGGMVQAQQAFGQLYVSLGWFLQVFPAIASWKASVDRVLTLERAMNAASKDRAASRLTIERNNGDLVRAEGLSVSLPDGSALIDAADLEISAGESVLISGDSGSGKTTLFKALSGLWPWADGKVTLPADSTMFFPQATYFPVGTLADAICYPDSPSEFEQDQLEAAMQDCKLQHLIARLDSTESWSQVLSGGEQQRVAVVRALLRQPQFLFLDESTASLDVETEKEIYGLLARVLSNKAIITIGHRPELKELHRRHWKLSDKQLADVVASGIV